MVRPCDLMQETRLMQVLGKLSDGREVIANTLSGRYWVSSDIGMSEISKEEAEWLMETGN